MTGSTSTNIAPALPGGLQANDRLYVSRGDSDFHMLGSQIPSSEMKVTGFFGSDPSASVGIVGAFAMLSSGQVDIQIPTNSTAIAVVTLSNAPDSETVKYQTTISGPGNNNLRIVALDATNQQNSLDASTVSWIALLYGAS